MILNRDSTWYLKDHYMIEKLKILRISVHAGCVHEVLLGHAAKTVCAAYMRERLLEHHRRNNASSLQVLEFTGLLYMNGWLHDVQRSLVPDCLFSVL